MNQAQINEEGALAEAGGTRHYGKAELDGLLRGGNRLSVDALLSNGRRSVREYKVIWEPYFGTHFLHYRDADGKQDPLRNLTTDTVLRFVNDPKREAMLTVSTVD